MWIAKISGVNNFDAAMSVDVSPLFAIGTIIDNVSDIRSVSKFDARRIFASVENCTTIAEVIPTSIDDIFETADVCQPNLIQVNGEFFSDENNLIAVQSLATIPIIGSIFLNPETLESNILDPDPLKAAQLLEKYVQIINLNLPIGKSWDSEKSRKQIIDLTQSLKKAINKPLVIGGGLNSANVGKIVSALNPNAVDVSSGVERLTGIKNTELMQEFLQSVFDNKDHIIGV